MRTIDTFFTVEATPRRSRHQSLAAMQPPRAPRVEAGLALHLPQPPRGLLLAPRISTAELFPEDRGPRRTREAAVDAATVSAGDSIAAAIAPAPAAEQEVNRG